MRPDRAISGHVFRVEGKRRPMWRAKYRLPDGRQVQRTIGKVWTERWRPPDGYFTTRTAEAWPARRPRPGRARHAARDGPDGPDGPRCSYRRNSTASGRY